MVRFLASLIFGCFVIVFPISSASWDSLNPGDSVRDRIVEIGVFKFELPPGDWFVTAKYRSKPAQWSGSAAPVYMDLAFAAVEDGRILALLHIGTLASAIPGIIWGDDGCKPNNPLLDVRDGSSLRHPECLWIAPSRHSEWPSSTASSFGKQQLISIDKYPAKLSDVGLNVRYIRKYRTDFVHFNAILLQKTSDFMPSSVEAWAREVRESLSKLVARDVSVGVIPKLPVVAP